MRFPISSLIMIGIAGICLFMFVMFNYAYMSEDGFVEKLNESAQKTLTGDRLTSWDDNIAQLKEGFGIACVICFLLAIVFFVIDVLGDREGGIQ